MSMMSGARTSFAWVVGRLSRLIAWLGRQRLSDVPLGLVCVCARGRCGEAVKKGMTRFACLLVLEA